MTGRMDDDATAARSAQSASSSDLSRTRRRSGRGPRSTDHAGRRAACTSRDTQWPSPEPASTASPRSPDSIHPTECRHRQRRSDLRTRYRSRRSPKVKRDSCEGRVTLQPWPRSCLVAAAADANSGHASAAPCTGLPPVSYPTIASSDDDVDRCHPGSGSDGTDSPAGEISRPPLPSAPYSPWHVQVAGPISIMMPAVVAVDGQARCLAAGTLTVDRGGKRLPSSVPE